MSGYLPPVQKAKAALQLAHQGIRVNRSVVSQQLQALEEWDPDLIICHPKCTVPMLWAIQHHRKFAFLSPIPFYVHADERQPHTGINRSLGARFNRATYSLLNTALAMATKDSTRGRLGFRSFGLRQIYQSLLSAKFLFAVSPTLYPRQPHWAPDVQVIGHSSRAGQGATLDAGLKDFLQTHDRVLLLTFGSMISSDPERTSRLIYGCLQQIGYPVVVNLASGGLVRLPEYEADPRFCFTDSVSYPEVLSQATAIIHHGGSGTTHLGLKFGCPTLIVPHVFDQFTWGGLLHSLGVGPAPIAVNQIVEHRFISAVNDLLNNPSYQEAAARLSVSMGQEESELDVEKFLLGAS
jgi:UDP:flavonoid glycosyltransferase YjiC (YdhE family)